MSALLLDDDPNPFCTNRSPAGDACGACRGCITEVARIHVAFDAPEACCPRAATGRHAFDCPTLGGA